MKQEYIIGDVVFIIAVKDCIRRTENKIKEL